MFSKKDIFKEYVYNLSDVGRQVLFIEECIKNHGILRLKNKVLLCGTAM
ncbi:MAG TPA: hypothetical protein VEK38_03485 [Candidatus Bathyarchaeia archaeon]|nr:hypothetical protein [Candidatus Bathyarchaeia archaeon]